MLLNQALIAVMIYSICADPPIPEAKKQRPRSDDCSMSAYINAEHGMPMFFAVSVCVAVASRWQRCHLGKQCAQLLAGWCSYARD